MILIENSDSNPPVAIETEVYTTVSDNTEVYTAISDNAEDYTAVSDNTEVYTTLSDSTEAANIALNTIDDDNRQDRAFCDDNITINETVDNHIITPEEIEREIHPEKGTIGKVERKSKFSKKLRFACFRKLLLAIFAFNTYRYYFDTKFGAAFSRKLYCSVKVQRWCGLFV